MPSERSDLRLFLLQRRGAEGPQDRAMIICAPSEAHARVAAYERCKDIAWTSDGNSTCTEIEAVAERIWTIYAHDPSRPGPGTPGGSAGVA